jgi:hypothetical protein
MRNLQNEVEQFKSILESKIKNVETASFQIPNWQPTNYRTVCNWIKGTIYEGFSIKYKIVNSLAGEKVFFLFWEEGDEEPEFK